MEYRRLKDTDIEVSTVCMGCWAITGGGVWGPQDEEDALAAIRASLDAGVNFFDTAEGYGKGASEQLLARGLGERRREAVIATKVSPANLAPKDLKAACDRSLLNLKTDVIDLYQIHWPRADVPIAESLGTMGDLRDAGKVRAFGVSNFGPEDLMAALLAGDVATDQVAFSLLFRAPEFALLPLCAEKGVGVLCYSPLCQGLLAGKFPTPESVPEGRARFRLFSREREMARHDEPGCEKEVFEALAALRRVADGLGRPMAEVSLAWLLARPAVTSVIAGSRNAEQSRANAKAGDLALPEDAVEQLAKATDLVKEKLGPNMDLWQTESRIK